jgi:shikimate kinase
VLPQQIILLGLRGSGKSTLGKLLAARLVTDFVDLDVVTAGLLRVESAGKAIQKFGLAAFREAEVRSLQMPRSAGAGVLALGGGTPTAHGAIPALSALRAKGARLIYLRATPGTLRARLSETDLSTRPSLTGASVLEEIERLFVERDPLYRSLADHVIEIDGRSIENSLDDIAAAIRKPLAKRI